MKRYFDLSKIPEAKTVFAFVLLLNLIQNKLTCSAINLFAGKNETTISQIVVSKTSLLQKEKVKQCQR